MDWDSTDIAGRTLGGVRCVGGHRKLHWEGLDMCRASSSISAIMGHVDAERIKSPTEIWMNCRGDGHTTDRGS